MVETKEKEYTWKTYLNFSDVQKKIFFFIIMINEKRREVTAEIRIDKQNKYIYIYITFRYIKQRYLCTPKHPSIDRYTSDEEYLSFFLFFSLGQHFVSDSNRTPFAAVILEKKKTHQKISIFFFFEESQ